MYEVEQMKKVCFALILSVVLILCGCAEDKDKKQNTGESNVINLQMGMPESLNPLNAQKQSVRDAMLLSMRHHICEPEKKIVCGHFSAARCYLMKDATPEDWANKIYKDVSIVPAEGFQPFWGDTFIALDQSVKKTGFINCLVLDE